LIAECELYFELEPILALRRAVVPKGGLLESGVESMNWEPRKHLKIEVHRIWSSVTLHKIALTD